MTGQAVLDDDSVLVKSDIKKTDTAGAACGGRGEHGQRPARRALRGQV